MKKFLSMVLALTLAASLSAVAFAASYGSGGGDGDTVTPSTPNAPSIGSGTTASAPTTVVSPSAVTTALQSAAPNVSITGNAAVSKAVVESIAKATAPVTFTATNYTIVIDPKTVTAAADINLGVATSAPAAQASFEKYFSNNIATVAMAQRGAFGASLKLTVAPANVGKLDLTKVIYAYSYNPTTNSYSLIGNPTVANGKLTLTTTVGNDIIFTDAPLAKK